MISTYQLSKIDARLKQAFSSNKPFGGMHLLTFGDFVQYPPVVGKSLYTPFIPGEDTSSDESSESEQETNTSRKKIKKKN